MRLSIDVMLEYFIDDSADVLLQIAAAATADQWLERQDLHVYTNDPLRAVAGGDGIGQRTWARGTGGFRAEYRATVAIDRTEIDLATLPATAMADLPAEAIPYLLPSRYCESDRFEGFVQSEFAGLEGGALAVAINAWVNEHLTYAPGASSGTTTALMTFADRRGVCRDFAHLLAALARAGGIPARCVSAYAPDVDPPDFHAVAELWLGGDWRLVDATGMTRSDEIARVAVGRDATDIAFMTVFGTATMHAQTVKVTRLDDGAGTITHADHSVTGTAKEDWPMTDNSKVAPPKSEPAENDQIHHPRQNAGQDESITKRLEKNPEDEDARLDAALDESMDASDPPASTQPVHNNAPAESSGFDAGAEEQIRKGRR